jgi:glycosyltransferase involved in cell wall biosynthesis
VRGKFNTAVSFIHSAEAVSRVKMLMERERPDIAHLHNIYHQLTPAIIPILKKYGSKVVMTLHDYKLICLSYTALMNNGQICTACDGKHFLKPFISNCQGGWTQGLLLSAEALWHKWHKSYDGVDLFISPSRFLAGLAGRRVPADKIRVLRNGIDCDDYQPHYNDHGYALYFGRLSGEKGIETLLQAYAQMDKGLRLKVVGTGPLEEKLRTSYHAAEFLGYKTGQELKDIVANAAFIVVPSEWYENCSMVVLEAMALGKPVIGSRVGGIPEQIEDGESGLLFEMGNAAELAEKMKMLADNPERRIRMGKAARRKLLNDFALSSHCDELLKIYNKLMD